MFRGEGAAEEMIDDKGISKRYYCRKMKIDIYGGDPSCPLFVLTDSFYLQN